jgi:hypothetical protein
MSSAGSFCVVPDLAALCFPAHQLTKIKTMPTQANLLAVLEQQWLANHATIRDNTTCNKSYTCDL